MFDVQVKFEMSEKTTFEDLLLLNLHQYEDEVRGIVDKAVKESTMEKVGWYTLKYWFTQQFICQSGLFWKAHYIFLWVFWCSCLCTVDAAGAG